MLHVSVPGEETWILNLFLMCMHVQFMLFHLYLKLKKGMSELLRTAWAEAREGNASIKQQVRDIGYTFLNSVEISAREAVYIILQ